MWSKLEEKHQKSGAREVPGERGEQDFSALRGTRLIDRKNANT